MGIALAIGAHLWRELRIAIPTWVDGDILHAQPRGVLYFASAPGLQEPLPSSWLSIPKRGSS